MPRFGAAAASVEKDGETLELQVKCHVGLNRLVVRSGLAGYAACCAFSWRPVAAMACQSIFMFWHAMACQSIFMFTRKAAQLHSCPVPIGMRTRSGRESYFSGEGEVGSWRTDQRAS